MLRRWTPLAALLLVACGDDTPSGDDGADSSSTGDADTGETDPGSETGPQSDCGNAVVEGEEACDLGEDNSAEGTCTPDCQVPVCGDGYMLPDEECDDGNLDDADGCEADCSLPACDNGIIDPGEVCYSPWMPFEVESPRALAAADVDEDGLIDLITVSGQEALFEFHRGDGTGGFATSFGGTTGVAPRAPVLVDLDVDGHLDLVHAVGQPYCFMEPCNPIANEIVVWRGAGDGTFSGPIALDGGGDPRDIAVGDLDDDGVPDVVVADLIDKLVRVYAGTGDAAMLALPIDFPMPLGPGGLALADLDGDDDLDVGVVSANVMAGDNVFVLDNDGSGVLTVTDSRTTDAAGSSPIAIDDLDEDGAPDLLVLNLGATTASLFRGAGGEAGLGVAEAIEVGPNPVAVVLADLTSNGHLDFAIANAHPNLVTIGVGLGTGEFDDVPSLEPGGDPRDIVAAHFDDDGVLDLAVARSGGYVTIFLSNP